MAARTLRPRHQDEIRQKIKVSQLINQLTKHAFGEVWMSATQVRAAEVLLKKSIPDLQSTEHTGEGGGPVMLGWMQSK